MDIYVDELNVENWNLLDGNEHCYDNNVDFGVFGWIAIGCARLWIQFFKFKTFKRPRLSRMQAGERAQVM